MTIRIQTGDLVGVLSDVVPFASPDKESPQVHCVRLEWDGKVLHALATSLYHFGWSTWDPDDTLGDDDGWGGDDSPWRATIALDDVKHLIKVFKLPTKKLRTPLTIEHVQPGAVRVQRHRDTGHSALSNVLRDTGAAFPDVRKVLAHHDTVTESGGFDINPLYLASFAKVRPSGPLVLRFTGPNSLILASIGTRFEGGVFPIRDSVRLGQVATDAGAGAGDILRHGAGVLVSADAGEPAEETAGGA